jgi:putative hydrolase of the HAD superfamily
VSTAGSRRAVIFDLDDTLILEYEATMAAARAAASLAHERTGVDAARFADAVNAAAERLWQAAPGYAADGEAHGIWWGEALWGDFAGEGEVLRAMRAFLPGFRHAVWHDVLASAVTGAAVASARGQDAALADELQRAYIRARRSGEVLDPDAEAVLADLGRDHHLALLTNGAADVQREKLSRTRLARHFETIVISGEVGVAKPDPRIFSIVLERLGVEAKDAVMVGDSLARDVEGAHRAGLRAIWLDRGAARGDGPRADGMIRRLSDLRVVLDALEHWLASHPAKP